MPSKSQQTGFIIYDIAQFSSLNVWNISIFILRQ